MAKFKNPRLGPVCNRNKGVIHMTIKGQNPIAFATLCKLLNQKPHTKAELAEKVGVTSGTIVKWMQLLASSDLVYETEWHRTGTTWTCRWKWGYPAHLFREVKPKALSVAEYCKRYRRKKAGISLLTVRSSVG
jgi:predicted transcriptional regulator